MEAFHPGPWSKAAMAIGMAQPLAGMEQAFGGLFFNIKPAEV